MRKNLHSPGDRMYIGHQIFYLSKKSVLISFKYITKVMGSFDLKSVMGYNIVVHGTFTVVKKRERKYKNELFFLYKKNCCISTKVMFIFPRIQYKREKARNTIVATNR